MNDLDRIFPNLAPLTAAKIEERGGMLSYREKKRRCYVKAHRNELGTITHVIIHALVRDRFTLPLWIQGTLLDPLDVLNPIDHYFMGHETHVPDDSNDTEEDIVE